MTRSSVWARYREFLSAQPEITVEWHDPQSAAKGWLVMNSLRGGAAGGGTRMRAGVTHEEVVYLAKAMELKFALAGPDIGGAKSGIAFDPQDPRRTDVLRRWFVAIRPYLAECYGTGGDVNVDEQRDVLPLCRELGLTHPQQGIVVGHLKARGADAEAALENLCSGLALTLQSDRWAVSGTECRVSDMITGFGVARAARRLVAGAGRLDGLRVMVEGFGNVGAAAALYLSRLGARIVGLVDARHGLAAPDGLDTPEIEDLIRRRRARTLPDHTLRRSGIGREAAYEMAADLMVPAAISGSLDRSRLETLGRTGVRWIVCGANHPFQEPALGDTRTEEWVDERFTVLPDVVGSMGMARTFTHLMSGGCCDRPDDVFDAVGEHIDHSVDRVVERAAGTEHGLLAATVELALDRAGFGGRERG